MTGVSTIQIVAMMAEHAADVLAIYQVGIDEGQATFETTAPAWEAFDAAKLPEQRHVALDADGRVLGWVAASAVAKRCVYAGVVEHSVYVHSFDTRSLMNLGCGLAAGYQPTTIP